MSSGSMAGKSPCDRREFRHLARLPAQQGGKRVAQLDQCRFEVRYRRQRGQVLRLGLLQVQFRVLASLEYLLGDFETAFLNRGILLCDVDSQQCRPVCKVQVRHLGAQQYLRVLLAGDGRKIRGVGGFDATTESSPEVQFPANVVAGLIAGEAPILGGRAAALVLIHLGHRAAGLIQLRIAIAAGNTE